MLSDERTYLKLDNDPTLKYRKKLVSILDKMRSEKKNNKTVPTSESNQ